MAAICASNPRARESRVNAFCASQLNRSGIRDIDSTAAATTISASPAPIR